MIESLLVKYKENKKGEDYCREIELGSLQTIINKYLNKDIDYVVYKLSYAGKYLIIKGKTLAGSLILLADTYNSFKNTKSDRYKGHLYTHFFSHLKKTGANGVFTIKILSMINKQTGFLQLLKIEQQELDKARFDCNCLNNQVETYIPQYNETSGMFGWIPATAVMNFKRWLSSKERQMDLVSYKK